MSFTVLLLMSTHVAPLYDAVDKPKALDWNGVAVALPPPQ